LIIKCVAIGIIPINSAVKRENKLNCKCNINAVAIIAETIYLKVLNNMLELNDIAKILPKKNIVALAKCIK
jgi:hypothetical protein